MKSEAEPMVAAVGSRVEVDLVGSREVRADARYGVHALRAAENFARPRAQLLRDAPEFYRAFAMVKLAAAQANMEAGGLAAPISAAIVAAADELIAGRSELSRDLIVPLVQGGAGTSTNMNINEVLANRALELLGHSPGQYQYCHPNDHVNRSQSTNDVYPTAMRIALVLRSAKVEQAATRLEQSLRTVARQHDDTSKLGRTQLQDAVGMTVGDEFDAWADAVASARALVVHHQDALLEVNLGGTAIGTGLTASDLYRERVIPLLSGATGLSLRRAARHISATTDTTPLLGYSAALRTCAIALAKIANDLRLLSSGPNGGFGELRLPPVQGGSSMMPGKVNPVIAEFVNQLAFRIRGSDATVAAALDAAQLQLNAMLPLVACELLNSQEDLGCAMDALGTRCVSGIIVNHERLADLMRHDLGELSSIAAVEGYALAIQIAQLSDSPSDLTFARAGRETSPLGEEPEPGTQPRGGADA